jgi:hypothetical protein
LKKTTLILVLLVAAASAQAQHVVRYVCPTPREIEFFEGGITYRTALSTWDTLVLQSMTATQPVIFSSDSAMKAMFPTAVKGYGTMLSPYRFTPGTFIKAIHTEAPKSPNSALWQYVSGVEGWISFKYLIQTL